MTTSTLLIALGAWITASGALGAPLIADGPDDRLAHGAGRLAVVLGAGLVMAGMSL